MKAFSEKLLELRRREGFSQEQLADRLGVTRQSVSKWESGTALPELAKLIALSDLFCVSVDYLVKDRLEDPAPPIEVPAAPASKLEKQVEELSNYFRGYAWDSKVKIGSLPLISVRFHFHRHIMGMKDVARGVFAIGNFAVGIVSFGIISAGIFSIGVLTAGLLSLGVLSFGWGAFGTVAVGVVAGGVTALGLKVAVGIAALGDTSIGYSAAGWHVLLWGDGLTSAEIEAFLLEHHPTLWKPLLTFLANLGAHIR